MSSEINTLCEAVKTAINDSALSVLPPGAAPAVRSYLPRYTLPQLETFRTDVLPVSRGTKPASRVDDQIDPLIAVGVQKRVKSAYDVEELDALSDAVELIDDFLNRNHMGEFKWQGSEIVIYDPEMLLTKGVFESVIKLRYLRLRRKPGID